MLRIALTIFSLLLIFNSTAGNLSAEDLYSKETKFPPLKIEYNNFKNIVKELDGKISKVNRGEVNKGIIISSTSTAITLSDEIHSITLNSLDEIDLIDERYLDNAIYDVNYYYRCSGNCLISKIFLNLSNDCRCIIIEGDDSQEVEMISLFFEEKFRENRNLFSGTIFSILIFFLFMIPLETLLYFYSKRDERIFYFLIMPLTSIFSLFFALNIDTFFPRFIIYFEDSSFLDRYSKIFTFLSFLMGVIMFIILIPKFIKWIKDKNKETYTD